jgi:hypothetical protein
MVQILEMVPGLVGTRVKVSNNTVASSWTRKDAELSAQPDPLVRLYLRIAWASGGARASIDLVKSKVDSEAVGTAPARLARSGPM